jgi:transposase-like protein
VTPIARRRRFSGAEKRRILGEADLCTKPGQLGALLRREGVYSSMLTNWRKQSIRADEAALAPRKRGPKPAANREEMLQVKRLTQENARLQRELGRARTIIDVQKKLCTLLGLPTADEPEENE